MVVGGGGVLLWGGWGGGQQDCLRVKYQRVGQKVMHCFRDGYYER